MMKIIPGLFLRRLTLYYFTHVCQEPVSNLRRSIEYLYLFYSGCYCAGKIPNLYLFYTGQLRTCISFTQVDSVPVSILHIYEFLKGLLLL